MAPSPKSPSLAHNVYFWMHRPDDTEEATALATGIKTLADVKYVRGFRLGRPASTAHREVVDGSFSYHLTLFFDSAEDQNAYQADPIHKRFVEACSGLWKKVVVYDSDTSLV